MLVNTYLLYTETEMVHQFNNAGAKLLVMVDMFADKLPAVLARTGIQKVVLAAVSEFFPAVPGAIVRGVQRYWNRVLPPVTGTPIAEGYGLTETAPVVSFNPLSGTPRDGSIGIPAPATDVRLVDDEGQDVAVDAPGEIWVRGPQVMQGYWQADQETSQAMHDGWFATGDVAVMDEGGFMRIVDRKKDMILVSGFNVYPNEVEDVIADMAHVLEVAVIGVPDDKTGEAVRAYVVQNPDHAKEVMPADVIAHCSQHLAPYKVPKLVVVRDELPKSPIGKVLRKDLRLAVAQELKRA